MASNRFSIAAVILSYFLVAGGISLALILVVTLHLSGEGPMYGALGVGGLVGGVVAARASPGRTIIEPAIGGVLVIASLVAVMISTDAGQFLWHVARRDLVRTVAISGVVATAGAIVGAVVAERLAGGHSQSRLAWLFHAAFAMLGASFVVTVMAGAMSNASGDDAGIGVFFGGLAAGALLAGLCTGASAPRRILLPTMIGCLVGVAGFCALIWAASSHRTPSGSDRDLGNFIAGVAVIGIGCGLIALIGSAIGWKAVGKRSAAAAEATSRAFA